MSSNSKELVPAFETAIGMDGGKPVMVPAGELDKWNEEMKLRGMHETRYHAEAVNMAAMFASRAIRPDEIAALRRKMLSAVNACMADIDLVLGGKKTWTPTQVRLFGLLTERVMPKLSTISIDDNKPKKAEDLSIDELEAIVMGKKKETAVDAVMASAEVYDNMAEKHERRETKREVLNAIATMGAMDEAERKYVGKKLSMTQREVEDQTARQIAKPQPASSPDRVKKQRALSGAAGKGLSYKEWMLKRGMTEEEAEQAERDRSSRIQLTAQRNKENREKRLALTAGLGDAVQVPGIIKKHRQKVLSEFRVHPLKGVRSQAGLLAEREREEKREATRKERAENPRMLVGRVAAGIPDELKEKIHLRDFRRLRPDLFQEKVKPVQVEEPGHDG